MLGNSRTADRVLLGAALVLTGVAAVGHVSLRLDLENAAMKDPTSAAAAAGAARERVFGKAQTLLALLEPQDGARLPAAAPAATGGEDGSPSRAGPEAPAVGAWVERARALAGVQAAAVLPVSDPSGTLVALTVEHGADRAGALEEALRSATPDGLALSLSGPSVGERAIARALEAEQARIVPMILAAFALLLLAVYRSFAPVVAALLPGLGAVLWTGGIEHALGLSLDPVSSLLAPVVLTVGVAGAVHLIERHRALVAEGVAPAEAPGAAARALARPMVYTTLTTVAGFLALVPSAIPAVGRFGWLATLGVALTLVWTVAIVPSWLRVFPPRPSGARARHAHLPARHVAFLRGAAPWLAAGAAIAGVFLGWRALSIRVDTDPSRILPAGHPFRVESERIAARLGATDTFELLLPPQETPPAPLVARELVRTVSAEPLVVSLAGPPERSADGWLLATILLRPGGTSERARLFERVEQEAAQAGFAGARACGNAVAVAQDSEALVHGQRRGVLAILGLLWLAMTAALGSWRLGLLGLIPNALPCIALQGGLALADRPLSVATAMIATVLLGLIVDDTIHFLHAYRGARGRGLAPAAAIESALAHCGRAIVITSVVLTLGFAAGLAGRLTTTVEFAALCALTIVLALLCDLVLLPALLLLPGLARARSVVRGELEPCTERSTS